MASSVVVKAEYSVPSTTGDSVTINYTLAIAPGNGADVISESVDVTILADDTPNTVNSKIGIAVRERAAAHGLTIPANRVSAPAYSKA